MAKKGGENSKKAAGNAKKAESANKKKQAELQAAEAAESLKWEEGSKQDKKANEKFKKEEAARKKAEREALLKAEEESVPAKPSSKSRGSAKVAAKRAGKIDDFLDFNSAKPSLSASGIDNALEALALASKDGGVQAKDIDRHPERRVKAAYAAYEERRIPEIKQEQPGLRLQQIKNLIHKEFQKSPENPMNQDTNVKYNASRDEVSGLKKDIKEKREKKFT